VNSQDEARFELALREAIKEAKTFGYIPNKFIGMISERGAFQTVKDIVASNRSSDGFDRLAMEGRFDLTCEAIIVETPWRVFFDADLLEHAERRLTQYGYGWSRFIPATTANSGSGSPAPSTGDTTSGEPGHGAEFVPPVDDQRERTLRLACLRTGQDLFRKNLLAAYGARCCITGPTIPDALEAAHIHAYRGPHSNHLENGLLLRADLHNLFDRFLFGIEPSSLRIRIADPLRSHASYNDIDGVRLDFGNAAVRPSNRALEIHWNAFAEDP
jgi:hypothetical protein